MCWIVPEVFPSAQSRRLWLVHLREPAPPVCLPVPEDWLNAPAKKKCWKQNDITSLCVETRPKRQCWEPPGGCGCIRPNQSYLFPGTISITPSLHHCTVFIALKALDFVPVPTPSLCSHRRLCLQRSSVQVVLACSHKAYSNPRHFTGGWGGGGGFNPFGLATLIAQHQTAFCKTESHCAQLPASLLCEPTQQRPRNSTTW